MLKHMTCLLGFHISVIYCRIPYIHAVDKTNTGKYFWYVHVGCISAVTMNAMPHCLVRGFLQIILH